LKKHKLKGLLPELNIGRFRNIYQELIELTLAYKQLITNLLSSREETLNKKESISMVNSQKDFIKVVRKLDNKLWLDPEISKELHGAQVQADAMKNFRTSENTLSVFIADDANKIPRILAAIAANSTSIDKVDYAIFDTNILDQHGIKYKKCLGDTPDEDVNQLHVDLEYLTAFQVCSLAQDIQDKGSLDRFSKKCIKDAITNGINNKYLNNELVKVKL